MADVLIPGDLILRATKVLFSALALLLIVAVMVSQRFLRVLRQRHPEVWSQLGKPLFLNASIQTRVRLRRYVQSGKYQHLADGDVDRLARLIRAVDRVSGIAFWGLFVVIVVSFLYRQGDL